MQVTLLPGARYSAPGWYRWGYTRRHPFPGALFGVMVVPSVLVLLTNLAGQ